MARQNALAEGLEERVRFQVQDAVCLPFADAMFDGGWFLESIFHMGHAEALGEAHRVLKPGALLQITDFINLEHTTPEFIALQHEVLFAHHIRREEYPALLEAAGFELLEIVDMTNPVILAADSKNRKAFELYRDEMLQVAEQDYIPFVEEVSSLFAANAGYVAVKARRR
jgi:SAM-dependent methyltransferase